MAGDPEVLCPGGTGRRRKRKEGVMVVDAGEGGGGEVVGDGGELDIAVIVNQHAGVTSSAEISPEVSCIHLPFYFSGPLPLQLRLCKLIKTRLQTTQINSKAAAHAYTNTHSDGAWNTKCIKWCVPYLA